MTKYPIVLKVTIPARTIGCPFCEGGLSSDEAGHVTCDGSQSCRLHGILFQEPTIDLELVQVLPDAVSNPNAAETKSLVLEGRQS